MTEDELKLWLRAWIAEALDKPEEEIGFDEHVMGYGIESASLIGMIGDLEDALDRAIDPDEALKHPTINQLAKAIAAES